MATLLLSACTGRGDVRGNPACGIAALAGAERCARGVHGAAADPVRAADASSGAGRRAARRRAGAARPLSGRSDSGLVVGVEGALPAKSAPAFGVLVVQRGGAPQGVVLFEGIPIEAAPRLGLVSVGGKSIPLFGVEVDMAGIQDARCPLFPDSIAK